jgi:glycosyltransferase involved in cell wall biosynthesis
VKPTLTIAIVQRDAAYLAIDALVADRAQRIDAAFRATNDAALEREFEAVLGPLVGTILRVRELESEVALRVRELESEVATLRGSLGWRIQQMIVRIAKPPVRSARALRRRAGERLWQGARIARRLARNALRLTEYAANRFLDLVTHAASWRRLHLGRPRTMWGVTPILSFAVIPRCDRLLGLRSDSLVLTTYYTTNEFDIILKRLCETVYTRFPRLAGLLHKAILRWALIRYDTCNLFCDRGLLPPTRRIEINEREMQAMRRFGRRLYTYTYGADVRTREATLALGRFNICAECPEPGRFCICDDAEGSANIARIREYATAMIAMGDMIPYVPDARNFHFWPVDTAKIGYVGTRWSPGQTLRVAHAPNHPHFKGTHYLIAAIEQLQAEGRPIQLVSVQGVSNSEVLALFGSCDLVVDQFIAGFHGYTMFEAMAVGKPVLCYLRSPGMVTDPDSCPVINTWPATVYATLADCLDGVFDLAELGRRGRAYIERYHSIEAVALHLGALYLETAAFPARINRRIRRHMAVLEAGLPPVVPGVPPVSWDSVAAIDRRAEEVAKSPSTLTQPSRVSASW